MPSFDDVVFGKTPAAAQDIQQIIDALTARRNTPLATTVSDPIAYAYTIKNTDPSGRGVIIYAPDGVTPLFSVDHTGAKVSRAGGAAQTPIVDIGSGAGIAAEGNHVHGVGGYAGTGTVTLEQLYAAAWVATAINYVVGPGIMFVWCNAGVVVTLPDATTTNRPITVGAVIGTTTVNSTSGGVIGGSVNLSTGLVMDGVVLPGDAMTYKADGANWRAC